MIISKPKGIHAHITVLYPAFMLIVFFIVPFGIMVAISFFQRDPSGFYIPVFDISNYKKLYSVFFARVLIFSLYFAGLTAAICVIIGFPFTYFLTCMKRKYQVIWLVYLLSILSLSEVIVGFTWSVLLSRTAGITNLFVWLGLMESPMSLSPSFLALLLATCYLAFPYTVLMLYPPLSRLDSSLPEAAQTLGASSIQTFFSVVVETQRNTILTTLVMVFIFTLGVYLLPQILGRPQQWNLSVVITDTAIYQTNMPVAAAMAVFFMLISLAIVGLTLFVGKERKIKSI